MEKIITSIVYVLFLLIFVSCDEIFKKECSVNDDYKLYTCPDGYNTFSNYKSDRVLWIGIDSCDYKFSGGSGVKILDSISYNNKIGIGTFIDTSDFFTFDSTFLIGLAFLTDKGTTCYSKSFICVNDETESLIVRCQYEMSDQCYGSGIYRLEVAFWFSIPRNYKDYNIIYSVENVNPL